MENINLPSIILQNSHKLDGQSFDIWKFKLTNIFTVCKLISIVDGSKTKPQDVDKDTK